MQRTSASVSAPEPPRGSVHERRWRPKHDRVRELARAGHVDRHERLVRLPEQERLHVRALELAADHVPGRLIMRRRCQMPPRGCAREALVERRPEARRRERRRAEHVLDLVVLGERAPVGVRVGAREPRQLLVGALDVEPHRQVAAVRERDVRERVGHAGTRARSRPSRPSSSSSISGFVWISVCPVEHESITVAGRAAAPRVAAPPPGTWRASSDDAPRGRPPPGTRR